MTFHNPKGRVNYEPNSWEAESDIRENPEQGFQTYPEALSGEKLRIRSASFADHYSQARQFYLSQTVIEQEHLANALIFELSKVEKVKIRKRMLANLLNIDRNLTDKVAKGLGITELPTAATPLQPVNHQLKTSPALSILLNGPKRFSGRKLGILVTEGADAMLIKALESAIHLEKSTIEIIAPTVAGIRLDSGDELQAQQCIEGGPSVLYDAIAIITPKASVSEIANKLATRDFIVDAYAHNKFIGYISDALFLFEQAGIPKPDAGCVCLEASNAAKFIELCGKLRFWERSTNSFE